MQDIKQRALVKHTEYKNQRAASYKFILDKLFPKKAVCYQDRKMYIVFKRRRKKQKQKKKKIEISIFPTSAIFVAFVEEFNKVFRKSCRAFCAKPKEVDPIKLISLRQINVSIALKYSYIIKQQRIKIN